MRALFIALLWASPVGATPFDQVLTAAAEHPSAQAAALDAERAELAVSIIRRQATAPTLGASVSAQRLDRQLTLGTPFGALDFGARTQYSGGVVLTQPLLDAPALFYRAPAAEAEARAARGQAASTRQARARAAADLYLDVLALDARRRAVDALIESLRTQLAEVDRFVGVGRALERDRLTLSLAVQDAEQGRLELDANRVVLTEALGRAMGRGESIEPGELPDLVVPPSAEAAIEQALAARGDLRALAGRIDAAERRADAVWAELIPRVEVRGELVAQDGAGPAEDYYVQGVVQLSWAPLAGFTRAPRAAVERTAAAGLRQTRLDAERGVAVQVRRGYSALSIARGEADAAERAITAAEEARRVTAARFATGRDTVTDLIDAEATLADRQARRQLAVIDDARARVAIRAALHQLVE